MDCSTPGFPVLHCLLELTQALIHWVNDAILPAHSLSTAFCSCPLSQHQGLFQWVGYSHQVTKVLEFQLLASVLPMNIQGWFPLGLTSLISLLFKWLSRVFSSTTVQKYQFFGTQSSLWSNSHICTWLLDNHHCFDYMDLCHQRCLMIIIALKIF